MTNQELHNKLEELQKLGDEIIYNTAFKCKNSKFDIIRVARYLKEIHDIITNKDIEIITDVYNPQFPVFEKGFIVKNNINFLETRLEIEFDGKKYRPLLLTEFKTKKSKDKRVGILPTEIDHFIKGEIFVRISIKYDIRILERVLQHTELYKAEKVYKMYLENDKYTYEHISKLLRMNSTRVSFIINYINENGTESISDFDELRNLEITKEMINKIKEERFKYNKSVTQISIENRIPSMSLVYRILNDEYTLEKKYSAGNKTGTAGMVNKINLLKEENHLLKERLEAKEKEIKELKEESLWSKFKREFF